MLVLMRTTLDLDDRLLAAARARARRDGTSLGAAVSKLGLSGLDAERREAPAPVMAGIVMLPVDPQHTITTADIDDALDDD